MTKSLSIITFFFNKKLKNTLLRANNPCLGQQNEVSGSYKLDASNSFILIQIYIPPLFTNKVFL